MTTKSDFPEEEWTRIVRAPFVAGLSISLADPGGPIEAAKESMATIKSATNPPSREQLLAEVALEVQAHDAAAAQPPQGLQARQERSPGGEVLDELRAVQAIVAAACHAGGDGSVRAVAGRGGAGRRRAAKDGGFMGFGAKQVSDGEQAMLDQVRDAVTT